MNALRLMYILEAVYEIQANTSVFLEQRQTDRHHVEERLGTKVAVSGSVRARGTRYLRSARTHMPASISPENESYGRPYYRLQVYSAYSLRTLAAFKTPRRWITYATKGGLRISERTPSRRVTHWPPLYPAPHELSKTNASAESDRLSTVSLHE